MAPRTPPRQVAAFLIAGLFAAFALFIGCATHGANAAATAVLDFPKAVCTNGTIVGFMWQPADGATEVWLDVSTDEAFTPGGFTGNGPFSGTTTSYALSNLKADTVYFARVNSRTSSGWMASPVVAFVPCGSPQLIDYTSKCSGDAATASFRWAPASPQVTAQLVEAGTDQGFSADKTRSSGGLLPLVNKFDLSGLRANVTNYLRISATLADGTSTHSRATAFTTPCGGPFSQTSDELIHTSDTLVYSRLNIKAPVNMRKVGYDGAMGVPEGKDDVVLYDFSNYRNLGGSPGKGGTSIIAGHLDYHPNFEAVFWNLAKSRIGDIIDYYTGDGAKYSYQVAWVSLIPSDESLNQYFVSTDPETIILITCEGNFDRTVGNYDKRALVYAVQVKN